MKVKTSITLSDDLLAEVDARTGPKASRSAFIESALRAFLVWQSREVRDARETERLHRHADDLNAEAADVLTYQTGWPDD